MEECVGIGSGGCGMVLVELNKRRGRYWTELAHEQLRFHLFALQEFGGSITAVCLAMYLDDEDV